MWITGRWHALLLVGVFWALAIKAEDKPRSLTIDPAALLPPEIPWDGTSRSLIAADDDLWITPAEKSDFHFTPSYEETVAWLHRLAAASPKLNMLSIGQSWEGRDLWMVVADADGAATPEQLSASEKPVLLAQAGIHAGEIDGKDAGMMFLREVVLGNHQYLLDNASFLFVPILNTDGHERVSTLSRINQRGPNEMGWRTNARNLNLNRDYSKLDTPEVRAVVAAIQAWQPDLYLDLHVTDGIEKQPDVTWSFSGPHAYSPEISSWLESRLSTTLRHDLEAMGHIPGPHIFVLDREDPSLGILHWEGGPRYSDGYGAARHLPTVLVENHSLKPYKQRVLGMTVLLISTVGTLGSHGAQLQTAMKTDAAQRPKELTLGWAAASEPEPETHEFLAIESHLTRSEISGDSQIEWNAVPLSIEVPKFLSTRSLGTVVVPTAYWIPAAWSNVIALLEKHGIEFERIETERQVAVEMYRFAEPQFDPEPFEGHLRVRADSSLGNRVATFPAGSIRVATNQALGILATLLLEPGAPDSFFQWGFFSSILQRTEYAESYVLEPLAREMLRQDPELEEEFRARVASDEEFASSPQKRLEWFYNRSPLLDSRWRLYPVGREVSTYDQ